MGGRLLDNRFALIDPPAGTGGHSVLYRASDLEQGGAPVAVKVFKPSRGMDDRVLKAAWSNELSAYQALGEHRNLARLIDWGRRADDGAPFLVFEWLERDLLQHLPLVSPEGWDDFWPLARDVLVGLSLLHTAGFVHRDVKPQNILVSATGDLKIADFGTTRMIETINIGLTMGPIGTLPYAPPERGTSVPSAAYDVYSFGVLVTACLATTPLTTHDEVVAAFDELDLPPDIGAVLAETLRQDPGERPESAAALLARLQEIQTSRELRRTPEREVFLAISGQALTSLESQFGLAAGTGAEFLREDLSSVGAMSLDHRGDATQAPDIEIAGQSVICRCQPHRTHAGVLMILRVLRPSAGALEMARTTWWRGRLKLRLSLPTDPGRAALGLDEILREVTEANARRAEEAAAHAAAEAFAPWKRLLDLKFALERQRGSDISYSGFQALGSRVRFQIEGVPDVHVGEGRLVRHARRRVLFGEVEGIENDGLILYVTQGRLADLPKRGVLEFDTEASKSKLRREQAALERIAQGRAVRPELKSLLLDPSTASGPTVTAPVAHFFQDGLDDAKKAAVSLSLGSRDFTLVQGPPGTGKTTFIAELVAQVLSRNAEARVVLTSQTHIALDNALVRIQELSPQAVLVRLGPTERLTTEVEPLSLAAQMERWRGEVLASSRTFLRSFAKELGLAVSDVDVKSLADELTRRRDQLRELRSRLALRRAERRGVLDQLRALNDLAPAVLAAAQAVEDIGKNVGAEELEAAVGRFVDAGVQFAARLEAGVPLNDRLVELESALNTWQDEQRQLAGERARLRLELAEALGQTSEEEDGLIRLAQERAPSDPRLSQLELIAAEWEERFGRSAEFNAALIYRADVVAATCVGLTGVPGVDAIPFDLCIIDEASKATVTEALVPLAASRRWVLVGDDRQLPPFVEHALRSRELLSTYSLTRSAVEETLFSVLSERLPESCKVALTQQHRMHPVIGELVSRCFYGNNLTSVARAIDPVVEVALGTPVVWLDTSSRQDRSETAAGQSYRNRGEARVIARLLDRLNWVAENKERQLSVAVLTGYDGQRREILDALSAGELGRPRLSVRVATVDAYQGQEADVAVFSVTRCNEARDLGFLRSEERVNVALSRARDGLVIVGDSNFISAAGTDGNPLELVLRHVRTNPACAIEEA